MVFIFIRLHQIVASPQKPETAAGFELRVNEKVPGVKLPARLQANPRLSKQTFHLCATCFSDETLVKVVQ